MVYLKIIFQFTLKNVKLCAAPEFLQYLFRQAYHLASTFQLLVYGLDMIYLNYDQFISFNKNPLKNYENATG